MTAVLHHVALTVTDIDASVAWYSDLFGFKELVREDHAGGNGGYGVVLGPEDWSMFIVLNQHPTMRHRRHCVNVHSDPPR